MTSQTNTLFPIKLVLLTGKGLSRYTVQLHTAIPDSSYFKHSKLRPDRNNVRRYFLSSTSQAVTSDPPVEFTSDPPTPHYNTTILIELGGRERHLQTLYSSIQGSTSLVDAVVLCKVWARQRGLDKVCTPTIIEYRQLESLSLSTPTYLLSIFLPHY